MGEDIAISIAGWIRSWFLPRRAEPDCPDSPVETPGETPMEKYPEGVDLNQEWDEMDVLTPWALDEIDRLQERLKVSEKGNNKI